MEITFLGAARQVTGSCYHFKTETCQFLLDCGQFQGSKEINKLNYEKFEFDPKEVDFVLLTHAHLDHTGLLPKLIKEGFDGKIYSTRATAEITKIVLIDSAHIHKEDAEWDNKKRVREGLPPRRPLFDINDATKASNKIIPIRYDEKVIDSEITFTFRDAGHILGSAFIEAEIEGKRFVFSGDLGQKNKPILKDPETLNHADYLFLESTYGNRDHEHLEAEKEKLLQAIKDTLRMAGKILIPSFAIERTQEILYYLNEFIEGGKLPHVKVFVDSPMATKVTKVFSHFQDTFDEEAKTLLAQNDDPLDFKNLEFTESASSSMNINRYDGPAIIIAGSGMCTAGRIRHHMKHNLWKDNTTIIFVGYQGRGTLGRRIMEGEKNVKILGEDIYVKAHVVSIHGFSAHADRKQTLEWISTLRTKPKIFLIHGEPDSLEALKTEIEEKNDLECVVPDMYQKFTI